MERTDFLLLMDELFEVPRGTLKGPELLDEVGNWDSMAVLGLIAMIDEHCGTTVSPREFIDCRTVDDIVNIILALPAQDASQQGA